MTAWLAPTTRREGAHRQVPAMQRRRAVDAVVEVAPVLLGALQDDRSRRVGERALSDRDARGA